MDESWNATFQNLTEDQKEKISQFKDLSGFQEMKCFQILQANDWNLMVALDLALDGAYNEDTSIENFSRSSTNNHQNGSETSLRHRSVSPISSSSSLNENSSSSMNSNENHNENENNESLYVVLWNTTTWIFKLPFIIVFKTLNTFYEFFVSMIHPTLYYDPNGTVERFISEFEEKYGQRHPTFFRGSYFQAVDQGKRDIRFVLIYIHSTSYREIDKFCTTVIATQRFIDLINSENIIFWSCTVDYPEGYKAFQSLKASNYPFLALIGLKNHKMGVIKKIEGFHPLDSIVTQLKTAINNNEYSLMAARLERQERDMASLIRAQQDAAFEESLKADQEKERKKKEERERKEQEERLVQEKIEKELKFKEQVSELKKSLCNSIPDEPNVSQVDSLRILFKLPSGTRLERRFRNEDPVKYLYYFVFCQEKNLINFKLRTNFPTRDLPGHSPTPGNTGSDENEMNITLKDCNLGSNIVLFVHDLDS